VLFNLDGTAYHNTSAVPGLNSAGWDDATGLGTLPLLVTPLVLAGWLGSRRRRSVS
jgi:hypothetical protein